MEKTHDKQTRQHGTMIDHLVDKAEEIDFPHSSLSGTRELGFGRKAPAGRVGFHDFPSQDRRFGVSAFFRKRGRSTLAEVIVILESDRVTEPCEEYCLLNCGSS